MIERVSLAINIKLNIKVSTSVIGATSHTPVIPKSGGRIKMQANKITNPLADDMTADSIAFPIDVK